MANRYRNILTALIWNIMLAYMALALCRIIFVAVNYGLYADSLATADLRPMLIGALRFDTSAVCYMNIPYILLLLFPLHYKEGRLMQILTRGFFVACNGIGVIANLADAVYVPFTGRRTTWSLFLEFSNESNMGKVILTEIVNNWYLVLAGLIIISLLYLLYMPVAADKENKRRYYTSRAILFPIAALLIVAGMRGGTDRTTRPITLNDANKYINTPGEAAIVLNTPFSMIRSMGKDPFREVFFFDSQELDTIFTPVHCYERDSTVHRKNVVVFIMESFGKEYIGAYNPGRKEESLTPFLDSLISVSHTYKYSYGNGRKSIDGMPSSLSGIPMFIEPFFLTPASLNKLSGLAGELNKTGYHSAFFHGAPNGSMGFQAFSKATGFKEYYGMDEYSESPLHNGSDDFDGAWAIWDEPFFQYYAETMDGFKEPFVTALFSASSHHPFKIPEEYAEVFSEGKLPIHKCIRYTDNALRRFFEKAKGSEWFKNTLFVITADHSSQCLEARYKTSSGFFEIPIIFYLPSGEAPFAPATDSVLIAQQVDIMPTVLDYMGYDKPFLSFGKSLLRDTPRDSYAVNWLSGQYQYYKGDYLLLFDGEKATALMNVRRDPLLKNNLLDKLPDIQHPMERELKAIIQQYMSRMLQDRLVPENDNPDKSEERCQQ